MGLRRIEQINELIKEELGKILLEEIETPEGVLLTISRVNTSEDLTDAEVAISIYPIEKVEELHREVSRRAGWLQRLLNKQLSMHPLPRIRFVIDATAAEADRIEQLLRQVKKEGNKES